MMTDDDSAQIIRFAGKGALLSGAIFLITIAYTFGFLFTRGLSTEMLNDPATLLPWIHANTVAYVELWWIFALHMLTLLAVPSGLAAIAGPRRPIIRMATTAGLSGAVVGMVATMVNAASAPLLGAASATTAPAQLPSLYLMSEMAGGLGLHLRLLSYLLCAVWLTITGLTFVQKPAWRALGVAQLAVSLLAVVVVIAKPFDWLDLEPSLGFVFALVYLWIGFALLRRTVIPQE